MNRSGLRLFVVSASLLFWGIPQATAQQSVNPVPAPPQAPAPPGQIKPSTTVTVEKIVSEAVATVNQSEAKAAEMGNRSIVLNSRVFNGLPEKRLNIELQDVPLKDALKRVLEDSKIPYLIDDDVPNDTKVSIKLANAPLTTILDALTLSNRIGWRTEFKKSTTATTTDKTKESSEATKKNEQPSAMASGSGSIRGTGNVSGSYFSLTTTGNYVTQIHVGKTVTAIPNGYQFRTLDIEGAPSLSAQNAIRGAVGPQTPQMRVYRWQSQKKTFTCPRCHNSISILQQPEEVKCTKCHREFEDSWKVCPFDGTKRPEPKDKWRFCPICGKSITMEASWSAPAPFMDFYRLDLPAAFEVEQFRSGATASYPSLLDYSIIMEDYEHGQAQYHEHETLYHDSAVDLLAPFAASIPDLLLAQ
jgi:ribosomal protein S27AE